MGSTESRSLAAVERLVRTATNQLRDAHDQEGKVTHGTVEGAEDLVRLYNARTQILDRLEGVLPDLDRLVREMAEHLEERVRLHAAEQKSRWLVTRMSASEGADMIISLGRHPSPELLAQFTRAHTLYRTWLAVCEGLKEDGAEPVEVLHQVRMDVRSGLDSLDHEHEEPYANAVDSVARAALREFLDSTAYIG